MEISLKTIQEARTLGITKEYVPYVKRFKIWQTLNVDNLVLGKIKSNTERLSIEANLLKAKLSSPPNRQRTYALKRLAQITNFQKNELSKAIQTTNINHLLIFLETDRYFQIPYKDQLVEIPSTTNQLTDLANKILPLFARYSFELKTERGARYHERISLENYNKGLTDSNIDKVYSLVGAMEDARGIRLPFRLRSLLGFLFIIDFNTFCQYIDTLKTPVHFVAALEWMTDEQLGIFFKDHVTDNKWLLFEGIRQLVERRNNDDSLQTAKQLLTKLYEQDENFFLQTCEYEVRNPAFNQVLGSCLAIISVLTPDMVNQLFKIDEYTFDLDNKDQLFDAFEIDADENRIKILLSCIHKKWITYTDQALLDINLHLGQPLLTGYANYVVKYLCRFYPIDDIKKLWEDAFLTVDNIDSTWHKSQSSRLTYFMIIFARLFIYTLSLNDSDHRDVMKDRFINLFNNPIFMKRYHNEYRYSNLISIDNAFTRIKELMKIESPVA